MKQFPFTQCYGHRVEAIFSDCRLSAHITKQLLDGGMEHPEERMYKALWDSGSNHTVVSKRVVKELNLQTIAYNENYTAGGIVMSTTHLVNLILPNGLEIPSLLVSCCDIDYADILLGMDVITMCDFAITNVGEKTTFSFQIPSATTIDFEKQ